MRKIAFSLLLASAAITPAMAQPADEAEMERRIERREQRQQAREERQQVREERQQRIEQPRVERPDFVRPQVDRVERVERIDRVRVEPSGDNVERWERREHRREAGADVMRPLPQGVPGVDPTPVEPQPRGGRLERPLREDGEFRHHQRPLPNVMRRVPVVSDVPREGTQPPQRVERHRRDVVRWNPNWRSDHRHDWRRWRDRHRSTFRVGIYYDPFGWNYRPYSVGWRLWPSYYSSRYWINDPWMYRLPYAPPGYRWIRYWDDAILVDTWSGQVVDVIHNFFW